MRWGGIIKMGCFSFRCLVCDQDILSNSSRGERVRLFLLKDGKTIEQYEGEYDSYGRVFDEEGKSIYWKMDWIEICALMDNKNTGDGIAAIHTSCNNSLIPTKQSKNGHNQGWGDDFECLEDDSWLPER